MPSKIIINPRAERNRPMNVSGWWKKNVENGLAEPQFQARTSIPDRGLRLLANLLPHHAFLPQTLMM
ncbi:MAG: hypothetical protein QF687_06520 [Nitrospinaceae bacterium]|nr:hypothetical protein [Nitrospinaceae bacterium]